MICAAIALAAPVASATAAERPDSFTPSCPTANGDDSYGGVGICSGGVESWDGVTLDVDLTQPMQNTGGSHPLIVMLHGFGNNKREWESTTDEGDGADKYHWNNRWFAKHGYYVLSYTARGFRDGPTEDYQPPTPGTLFGSANPGQNRATIHLKSRDWEIRDTQWLAALVADAYPDVDQHRIAVTGGSYGGIESWLQAAQPTWTFPNERDHQLPVLSLQVAIPKYPSTDLAYSLAPNGHGGGPSGSDIYESSQGEPDSDTGDGNPIGVPKASYITGLFAIGANPAKGRFEDFTSGTDPVVSCTYGFPCEGPISITVWNGRVMGEGDPYEAADGTEDPTIRQIRQGLTEYRGAYYQDQGWDQQVDSRKVAVYSIQGWTDDLFPAVESFRMFKYLKRRDPQWPVEVSVADVGHSRAQNKPETWHRLNAQAFQWLSSQINGSHELFTTVSSEPTICTDDAPSERLTARTPEGLANGALTVNYPGGSTENYTGATDPDGLATDAIAGPVVKPGDRCRGSSTQPVPNGVNKYTAYSEPLPTLRTYVGLGSVTVPYMFTGAPYSAQLDARLFDRAPDGTELLMTRGTYRLTTPGPEPTTLELPLYGNHWRLQPGHQIRIDLTQVDDPTYRPSNLPSSISFLQGVTLELPIRQASDLTLGSAPPS
jgi:pimeloyl-ACP methyl ester carboxylesterase